MTDTSVDKKNLRTLRAIIAASFLSAIGVAMLSFAVPLVSLDARISGAWLGTGFAGFFLARLVAGPLAGLWSDRVGARMPLQIGAVAGAFAPLLYLLQPGITSLYAIQFLLGLVSGLIRPVGLAVLGGNAPEGTESRWFSYHVLAFHAAMFAGPLLGGFLYWNRAVEPLLVFLTVCMVFTHLIIFIGVPDHVSSKRGKPLDGDAPQTPYFKALLIAVFGRTFGIGVFVAFYPVLLSTQLHLTGGALGALYALPGLVTCLGLPLGMKLREQPGWDLLLGGMLLSAAGFVGVGLGQEIWHFVAAGIVMGLGSSLSITESMRLASAASQDQGRVFGITHLVTGLGFVAGPIFGGLVVQSMGSVGAPFTLAGLIGWFCLLPWGRNDGSNWDRSEYFMRWLAAKAIPAFFLVGAMVIAVHFFLADGKEGAGDQYKYTRMAMGTVVNLTLVADSQKAADDASRKAFAYMRSVQEDLDFRNPEGSVGRINEAAGKTFVEPSRRAYSLIRRAVLFSEQTGGVFDPTIGALTSSPLYYALDKTIAESKKGLVDYRLVTFDEDGRRVLLRKQGMALDLGGIAKGTIIDGTVKLLRKLNISAGIVEAGGDFYCFGDRDWTIGIRHPREDSVLTSITVREQAVCGSGDYEQFVRVEEKGESRLRHHIIDPGEMAPATKSIGVTVIAQSAELADALATTLFILGANDGSWFMGEHFPDAVAIWSLPDGRMQTTTNFHE